MCCYCFQENRRDNLIEVHRCLEETEELIYKQQYKSPVAAIITEPIQAEGGIVISYYYNNY